jgi:hypothetical protein
MKENKFTVSSDMMSPACTGVRIFSLPPVPAFRSVPARKEGRNKMKSPFSRLEEESEGRERIYERTDHEKSPGGWS